MKGTIALKSGKYGTDFGPIEQDCGCETCKNYTRSYLHLVSRDAVGSRLVSIHNVYFQLRLMREMREAIKEDRFPSWIKQFFCGYFKDESKYPLWACNALKSVGVDLTS
jgi:queuine tRNA-ribosyltransferase